MFDINNKLYLSILLPMCATETAGVETYPFGRVWIIRLGWFFFYLKTIIIRNGNYLQMKSTAQTVVFSPTQNGMGPPWNTIQKR